MIQRVKNHIIGIPDNELVIILHVDERQIALIDPILHYRKPPVPGSVKSIVAEDHHDVFINFVSGIEPVADRKVEQVPFRAGVPKTMVVEGSVITFHPQGCGVWGCENRLLANPIDLADGSRIKVVTILSEKTCADGSSFLEALVDLAD